MPRSLSDADIESFRERLIDAAERLFATHGPEAVTMRQLAAELGVSPMTPYRYFKDKDAILAATRARAFNRHAEALETAYEKTTGDIAARSTAAGRAYIRFAFDHPEAYKLMFDIAQPSEADYPELVAAAQRSRATLTRYAGDLVATGAAKGDPELIGQTYWAALHGPIMLQFSGKLTPGYDATMLIAALTRALRRADFGE
ncbi:MAG: TetR/AcrR family transcriptional regulator [Caulobacterales bacterium]